MVIQQPNSLPDDVKPKPHDANSAATVLNDVQMTEMPGGVGVANAADGENSVMVQLCTAPSTWQFRMAVVVTQLVRRSLGLWMMTPRSRIPIWTDHPIQRLQLGTLAWP